MPMELLQKKFFDVLQKYLPENSVGYCFDLWMKYRFRLKITKNRNSKLGDYRFDPVKNLHIVTINHNLNPYNFLITYVHEVAHLAAHLQYGRKKRPHGREWKITFRELMQPLLSGLVFPADILKPLQKHMLNPPASSCSDEILYKALRSHDEDTPLEMLSDILPGEKFIFRQRVFEKEALRRTRVLCREISSGKKYLIPKLALVQKT